jgi:PPOX class probable F420-dependent enzyme
MPPAPVPPEIDEFLRRPNPAVIASLRPDGSPHAVASWYDWEDGHVLLNMDVSRRRLRYMQADPRVALTVLDDESWYRQVSLEGVVVRVEQDSELRDADRLAIRYTGDPFGSRDASRTSVWIKVESWHAWDGNGPWQLDSR